MYASSRFPWLLRFVILLAASCSLSLAFSSELWADSPEQPGSPEQSGSPEQPGGSVQIAAGDVAELGVMVADSPGSGVLVKGVIAGSPAEAAGVTSGDFIMSIDGSGINDPTDLARAIRAKPTGSTVAIEVWRDGQQVTKQVLLAASTAAQKAGRAWLGVRLHAFGQQGARIAAVVSGSPAARAELRSGDLVTAFGDATIGNADDLIDAVSKQKPGDTIPLTVTRDGNELSYKVELGSVAERPFFSFRVPLGDAQDAIPIPGTQIIPLPPDVVPDAWSPWRKDFQELKREMEQIREQLRRATGEETESPSEPSSDEPNATPDDRV